MLSALPTILNRPTAEAPTSASTRPPGESGSQFAAVMQQQADQRQSEVPRGQAAPAAAQTTPTGQTSAASATAPADEPTAPDTSSARRQSARPPPLGSDGARQQRSSAVAGGGDRPTADMDRHPAPARHPAPSFAPDSAANTRATANTPADPAATAPGLTRDTDPATTGSHPAPLPTAIVPALQSSLPSPGSTSLSTVPATLAPSQNALESSAATPQRPRSGQASPGPIASGWPARHPARAATAAAPEPEARPAAAAKRLNDDDANARTPLADREEHPPTLGGPDLPTAVLPAAVLPAASAADPWRSATTTPTTGTGTATAATATATATTTAAAAPQGNDAGGLSTARWVARLQGAAPGADRDSTAPTAPTTATASPGSGLAAAEATATSGLPAAGSPTKLPVAPGVAVPSLASGAVPAIAPSTTALITPLTAPLTAPLAFASTPLPATQARLAPTSQSALPRTGERPAAAADGGDGGGGGGGRAIAQARPARLEAIAGGPAQQAAAALRPGAATLSTPAAPAAPARSDRAARVDADDAGQRLEPRLDSPDQASPAAQTASTAPLTQPLDLPATGAAAAQAGSHSAAPIQPASGDGASAVLTPVTAAAALTGRPLSAIGERPTRASPPAPGATGAVAGEAPRRAERERVLDADATAASALTLPAAPTTPGAVTATRSDSSASPQPVDSSRGAERPAPSPVDLGSGWASAPAVAGPGSTASPLTAPAEARIAVPMDSPAFGSALGAQVSVFARDGIQAARLHLNPADMGPVSVQIVLEGATARVEFQAERATTRALIEASLPALAGAMQDAGLTLTGGGVFQQQPDRQPPPEPGTPPQPRAAPQDRAPTLAAPMRSFGAPRGLVDLVA